jgi:hypothetical protein
MEGNMTKEKRSLDKRGLELDENHYRIGAFSSSSIFNLIKKGRGNEFSAPGLNYINEKNIEWKLGRSLSTKVYTPAIMWGYVMEVIVSLLLEKEYKTTTKDFRAHKDEEFNEIWVGTPDFEIEGELIAETKSYQLKKFSEYTDCLMRGDIEELRSNFPQEYWQIVSNCAINGYKVGEAISYMPYKEELQQIRLDIEETNFCELYGFEPHHLRFLVEKPINEFAYLKEGGYYKNLTRFRFEVPQEDLDFLTERVRLAKELLIKYQ